LKKQSYPAGQPWLKSPHDAGRAQRACGTEQNEGAKQPHVIDPAWKTGMQVSAGSHAGSQQGGGVVVLVVVLLVVVVVVGWSAARPPE
jgi:hypothetical protein